jgi:hypothetical protein
MSKRYKWKVPGVNFKLLTPDKVEHTRSHFGKGQSAVKYDNNESPSLVLLLSKNIADITNAIELGVWEHSHRPTKLKPGMTAYILPTKELSKKFPHLAHGAWFRVAGEAVKSEDSNIRWQSEVVDD